jgi:hypothetical protein
LALVPAKHVIRPFCRIMWLFIGQAHDHAKRHAASMQVRKVNRRRALRI